MEILYFNRKYRYFVNDFPYQLICEFRVIIKIIEFDWVTMF